MINQTSQNFRTFFLINFTTELIKHSRGEVFLLENALKREQSELKEQVKETLGEKDVIENSKEVVASLNKIEKPEQRIFNPPPKRISLRPFTPVLKIPEPRLPPQLQYLQPTPTQQEIDLGKLNPLIKDPLVKIIQCNGEDTNIIVEGTMGRKTSSIILSKEDIDNVINTFSKIAKIPVDGGAVKIVAGRLILLAVISDVVSTKFLIKKISSYPSSTFPRAPIPY